MKVDSGRTRRPQLAAGLTIPGIQFPERSNACSHAGGRFRPRRFGHRFLDDLQELAALFLGEQIREFLIGGGLLVIVAFSAIAIPG
jgi:hypothetical protein